MLHISYFTNNIIMNTTLFLILVNLFLVNCTWYEFPKIGSTNKITNLTVSSNCTLSSYNKFDIYYLTDCSNGEIKYTIKLDSKDRNIVFNNTMCPFLNNWHPIFIFFATDLITINYIIDDNIIYEQGIKYYGLDQVVLDILYCFIFTVDILIFIILMCYPFVLIFCMIRYKNKNIKSGYNEI